MYIDKLDDVFNKYNNTCHYSIKAKPADVKKSRLKKLMVKILKLKLVILLGYQNIKTFLQKTMFQIDLKKILLLQRLKILFSGHMILVILKATVLLERLTKKNS